MQKILATPLAKVKISLTHDVAKTKDNNDLTIKYWGTHFGLEQRMGFVNKEMARLEAEVVMAMQKTDASLEKAEQLLLEDQCVPWLPEKARKFHKRMLDLENAALSKVSKSSKLLANTLK